MVCGTIFLRCSNSKGLRDEKGLVLPTALVFLGVLALMGTTAIVTTTTEIKIGGNHKVSEQAFYCAQAGCEEARARLRRNATNVIIDSHPAQTQWRAYIGSPVKTKGQGYAPHQSIHARYDSLLSSFDYTVQIRHLTSAGGGIVYWGDADGDGVNERNTTTGENIYIITSSGWSGSSRKTVETEVTRVPSVTVPSALYVEQTATVQGSNTYVLGTDACGDNDRPGIVTPEGPGAAKFLGSPHVEGAGGGEPNIVYDGTNVDIRSLIDSFKGNANFSYVVDSATHSAADTPGPGEGWGHHTYGATPQDPSSCSSSGTVYYDTGGSYVTLSDGVSGCGILLVEGDLEIDGDFSWYGPIIVTGSAIFTGGGNKHITGSLMAGGSAVVGDSGGSTNIIYCSSAISDHTRNRPLRLLSWKEDM
jgi:Tfp pilus assembly protein PilX